MVSLQARLECFVFLVEVEVQLELRCDEAFQYLGERRMRFEIGLKFWELSRCR